MVEHSSHVAFWAGLIYLSFPRAPIQALRSWYFDGRKLGHLGGYFVLILLRVLWSNSFAKAHGAGNWYER